MNSFKTLVYVMTLGAVGVMLQAQTLYTPSSAVGASTNSNVGIGTASPGSPFAVSGGMAVGTDYVSVTAPTNGLLVEGSLGIGTTNPASKLDVTGGPILVGDNRTSSGVLKIAGSGGATYVESGLTTASGSVAPIYFTSMQAASTWMTIGSTGNIGIGTSTPGFPLAVMAGASVTAAQLVGNTAGTDTGLYLMTKNPTIGFNEYWNGTAHVFGQTGSNSYYGGRIELEPTTGIMDFRISTAAGLAGAAVTVGTPLRLYPDKTAYFDGNVGIGTTTPAGKIDVYAGSSLDLVLGSYTLDLNANGTASGWARSFRVTNSGLSNGQNGVAFGAYGTASTPNYAFISIPTADQTGYDSGKILVLNNAGNVGIGTNAPTAKLEVAGDAKVATDLNVGGAVSAATLSVAGQSIAPTNLVQATGNYVNPAWIASLDASKIQTGTLSASVLPAALSSTSLTATGGVVTGSSTAGLTLNAGGSGQNITLTPGSGGNTVLGGNVGIGTVAPIAPLTVQSPGTLPAGSPTLVVIGQQNAERIQIRSAGGDAAFGAFQSGGNLTAAVALTNGSNAGYYQVGGYDGTGWTRGAWIQGRAAENWSATNHGTNLVFSTTPNGASGAVTERVRIDQAGNVGIGTTNPTQKLSVNGTIRAKEVIVDSGWSDYVFAPNYRLAPLSEVEQHIKTEGHLPGIPSASDVAEHGVTVGEMQAKLLAKVEELTLHVIEQEKAQNRLVSRVAQLEHENAELRSRLP